MEAKGDKLVNEAIKRILLDIVIRGHGDRLIGRWSRQPELQNFLEQVPYMLDRINQLHLACTRNETIDSRHLHHYHHKHHHQSSDGQKQQQGTSINDFISLIGAEMHWLVRTRDTMGLTPLHKAVLHCNRPIVEYIIDRYQGELAVCVWRSAQQARWNKVSRQQQQNCSPGSTPLIDAQDKYGRSALHYAAALQSDTKHQKFEAANHIYQMLIEKGASLTVRDFRGKTPNYYVRHPNQLRSKSIIHLANKLNANFQANVLSKTLRASSKNAPILEQSDKTTLTNEIDLEQIVSVEIPEHNRESMSISCHDLRAQTLEEEEEKERVKSYEQATSEQQKLQSPEVVGVKRSKSSIGSAVGVGNEELGSLFGGGKIEKTDFRNNKTASSPEADNNNNNKYQIQNGEDLDELSILPESLASDEFVDNDLDKTLKWLINERCSRQILDQRTKQTIRRCLSEGIVNRITELLIEGYGSFIMSEAATSCWNQQCKRYIYQIMPNLLAKLDTLHELIATNQFLAFKSVLNEEPILARIRRPYKRAASNALHLATQLNRRSIVKFLVNRYPELVSQRDSHGATCLHLAAKSLSLERIYFWLLELFSKQLEQITDSRGKLASEYRQQALRMIKLGRGETHLTFNSRQYQNGQNCASELLKQTQEASDQLQLIGQKCTLSRRKPKSISVKQLSDNNLSNSSETNTIVSENLDKSIEIDQLDDANQIKNQLNQEQEFFEEQKSSTSTSGLKQQQENENPAQMRSEKENYNKIELNTKRNQTKRQQNQTTNSRSENQIDLEESIKRENKELVSEKLLSEMVQLDSEEFNSDSTSYSQSTKSLVNKDIGVAQTAKSGTPIELSRPNSGAKLETIILSSILNDDFKKLEHLILAGCGNRLIEVFEKHCFGGGSGADVSEEMRNFFKTRVRNYMESIQKIHQVLHHCFAHTQLNSLDLNSSFHKLCNLLNRTSLIMCRDSFGATPLHVALMRSDKRLVDYLVRRQPEVASAPDYQNRNAFHYATLTLAAHKYHGNFKLTLRKEPLEEEEAASSGYWLVDENSGKIYENLCSRYAELLEVKDKGGLTCLNYLQMASEAHAEKVNSGYSESKLSFENDELQKCCPEYAKLLARYNYVFVQEKPEANAATVQTAHDNADDDEDKEEDKEKDKEKEKEREMEMEFVAPSNSVQKQQQRSLRRSGSCETASGGDTKRPLKRRGGNSSSSQRAHTADELLKQLDGELHFVPAPSVPLEAAFVRQVAPKPTVGSATGFHQMPLSPTNLDCQLEPRGSGCGSMLRSNQQSGRHNHHHRRQHHRKHKTRALLDDLDPNQQPSPVNHHRHHHHHRHHYNNTRSRRSPSSVHQSVVGGVIVPTIIHNDKMDEIETYDIIYRPPPVSVSNGQGDSSESSFSSSSLSEDEEQLERVGRHSSEGKPIVKDSVGGESAESDCDSINLDDEDYDDRVERLSSEFENRVRKEKNELRAKVDQIMNEIRMSSKSEKTSRFLSSPTNIKLDTNQPATSSSVQNQVLVRQAAGSSRSSVAQSSCSSLSSSSGHSSARTASSSASSISSNTTVLSCSSSNSHTASYSSSSGEPPHTVVNASTNRTSPVPTPTPAPSRAPAPINGNKTQPEARPEVAQKSLNLKNAQVFSLADQVSQVVSKNAYGQTYLHFIASRSQNPSILYKVLTHGSHLIGERDIFYRTARDVAVQFNLPNNVQILDKFIIDLFIEAKTGLLRHLLNQGYSPLIHVSDPDGNDIMLILKLLKLDRMIHFLLQMADFQRWRDELHTFIRHGYSAGVSELIKKHADLVKAKSVHSLTSLHLAALFDRADMVQELLEMDPSSVHQTDNMGRTALHYIYGLNLNNMDQIRDKLMACGASLEARDAKMRTPKYYFIFKREIEDIKRIELELN